MGNIEVELTWRWWRLKFLFQHHIGRHIGYPPPWPQVVIHVCDRIFAVAAHVGRHHDPASEQRIYDVVTAWLENFQTETPTDADVRWLMGTTRAIAIEACLADRRAA